MCTITFENNGFVYNEKDQRKILLDCTDLLSNKSRIPLHSYSDDLAAPNLISQLIDKKQPLAEVDFLLDILVAFELVKTSFPVKVLELLESS